MKDTNINLFLLCIMFVVGLSVGLFIGSQGQKQTLEREAVLKNHASWVVDAKGDAKFEWKK